MTLENRPITEEELDAKLLELAVPLRSNKERL